MKALECGNPRNRHSNYFNYSEVKCETFYIDHLGNTGFLDVVNNRFSNRQLGNPQNWKQLLIHSEPL